ncbi:MAG: peroxide stress protein YaaA [Methanobacteriota archaeon]|nr:MAG: peroxide stress protein YaaA [Euryarchaeota archaeon]
MMPAYLRYQGNMYHEIPQAAWENRKPGVEVLIASGLYGMVASRDTIFAYPHSMAEVTPGFGKMNRWWRDHGLAGILAAYLKGVKPKTVVDLLSLEYRDSVAGFADGLTGVDVKTISFPGMGRESQPMRGLKIAEILRTGKV